MRIERTPSGLALIREPGDPPARRESAVTTMILRRLNQADGPIGGGWTRFNPSRVGLTDCRQGVRNRRTGVVYWHERYQAENAAEAYRAGGVFYGVSYEEEADTTPAPVPAQEPRT